MRVSLSVIVLCLIVQTALAQEAAKLDTSRGDAAINHYFEVETTRLEAECLKGIETLDQWNAKKGEYRRQLFDMLGLDPLPERSDLKATTTGKVEHDEFTVEKVHFQSLPHLYVTG